MIALSPAASTPDDIILPLQLHNISYQVAGKKLLDNISLTLSEGKRSIILGPNGAGKSVLLRLCHGLLQATSGRVQWAHDDPRLLRRNQAMVLQQAVLLRRSVSANLAYVLALRGIRKRARRSLIEQALQQVGLSALANRPAHVLSGGEKQRLALARAWILQPQVLFLDEPTANLDPGASRLIERIIDAIGKNGCKLVMSTHDLGQARRHSDEIIFLHRGRLLTQMPAPAFFDRPPSPEIAAFLAGELLV